LLSDIDPLFGKGKRSAFLTEIVEREVRRQKLLRALDDAAGCWKPEDHAELDKGSAAFVIISPESALSTTTLVALRAAGFSSHD
jgi:hypothetical protein